VPGDVIVKLDDRAVEPEDWPAAQMSGGAIAHVTIVRHGETRVASLAINPDGTWPSPS
jgi:hypothetical protein